MTFQALELSCDLGLAWLQVQFQHVLKQMRGTAREGRNLHGISFALLCHGSSEPVSRLQKDIACSGIGNIKSLMILAITNSIILAIVNSTILDLLDIDWNEAYTSKSFCGCHMAWLSNS